jgi:predicted MFS family arabinose efflux permease
MAVIPLYLNFRGLSYLEIGLISSLGSIPMIALPVLAGSAADTWSKKMIILISQICSFLLTPLYVLAGNFPSLLLLQLIVPALYSIAESISSTISVDIAKGGKVGMNLGILRSAAAGWSIGSFSTGLIMQYYGFEFVFFFMAVFYFIAFLIVTQLKDTNSVKDTATRMEPKTAVLSNLHVLSFLAIIILVLSTMPAFYSFLPLYLKNELLVPESLIPLVFTITPLGEIPLTFLVGRLSDRFDRRKAVLLCLLAYPVRWTAIMMLSNFTLILPVQILHGFTFAGLNATSIAYLSTSVPTSARGTIVGAFSASFSLAVAIGGYVLGLTVQNYGFQTMYLQAIITSLIAIVIFILVIMRKKKPTNV